MTEAEKKIYEGEINHWVTRGAGGYGFVRSNLGRLFFLIEDFTADNVGRKHTARIIGNPVRFRAQKKMHRGKPTLRASEVTPVFDTSVSDPINHREVLEVVRLLPRAAFLRRQHGDEAYLTLGGVAEEHKHNFHKIKLGDHVWSGFKAPEDDRRLFLAVGAEFYSQQEESHWSK